MNTPTFDGASWRKSSHSGENGSCVEAAVVGSMAGVRDSKHTGAGHLALANGEWYSFVSAVKNDRFEQ